MEFLTEILINPWRTRSTCVRVTVVVLCVSLSVRLSVCASERMKCRVSDNACKAKRRALETEEESIQHRVSHNTYRAKKRPLETDGKSNKRRKRNRVSMSKRASGIPVQHAIDSFIAKTKLRPDYVCTCCHHLMYKQTVVSFNRRKYAKLVMMS